MSYPPTPQRKACDCSDPCISTDDVYYAGPNLPNSGINTYNVLTEVIEKLDAIYAVPTLQRVTEMGNYTTLPIIADSFVKIGGDGTNLLLDNGTVLPIGDLPAGVTETSQLINDGEDGINPFITALDIPAFNPSDYDLDEFTNLNADPFAHLSDIPAPLGYVPVNKAGDTMLGDLILNQDPSTALQAATKQYVDNIVSGINFHPPVVVATDVSLVATYNNGLAGVGATLTGPSVGVLMIDGETPAYLDRILVWQQADPIQNGIYDLTTVGDSVTVYQLTRSSDADNSPPGEIHYGDYTLVLSGDTNGGFGFICNTPGTIDIGITPITYIQFNAAQAVTAGYGLQELTPNVISIDPLVTQEKIILTTTGSGAATLVSNTLNIPTLPSFLEYNETDKTVWNNGKGNINSNTTFGGSSLVNLSTSINNTAFGFNSLSTLSNGGNNNTAIGVSSLSTNNNEASTSVGSQAMFYNTGGYNTAVGFNALYTGSGSSNVAIGVSSLQDITTGSNNVAIGASAGRDILVMNSSVFIGQSSIPLASGQTNQIVIGQGATGAGSNTATLGNDSITSTILKGLVKAPLTTNALIEADTTGKAVVTKEYVNNKLSTYKTYFINTATGNNTTGVYQDANKPFASIDYVNSNFTITDGDIFYLQGTGQTYALNGQLQAVKQSFIAADGSTNILDFSSNANASIMVTGGTLSTVTINMPNGKIRNERSGGAGVQFNSYGYSVQVDFNVREIYWNTSNQMAFTGGLMCRVKADIISSRTSLLQFIDNDIIIQNFICLANNTNFTSYGKNVTINKITGSGSFTLSNGNENAPLRYFIGDVTATGGLLLGNGFSNAVIDVTFNNSTINILSLATAGASYQTLRGHIKSVTTVNGTSGGTTKFINFVGNFGTGTVNLTVGSPSVSFENCSIKSTNSPITIISSSGTNSTIEIKNSSFEVVNAVPLITGGAGGTNTVKVDGLSHNATTLSDQIGTGVTVSVIGKQVVADGVDSKDAVNKGQVDNRLVVETTSGYTLTNADSGGIVIFKTTAAQTLTIPTGLADGFECTFVTLSGVTLTVVSTGNTLNNATSTTMLPQLSFTLKRMLAANTYIVAGSL